MTHFPVYSNVSRWVFSGGKRIEYGNLENEFNSPLHYASDKEVKKGKLNKYENSVLSLMPSGEKFESFQCTGTKAHDKVKGELKFKDSSANGIYLLNRIGRYQHRKPAENIYHVPKHGRTGKQDHLKQLKVERNFENKRPSVKSNKDVQKYHSMESNDTQSRYSPPLSQYSGPRRHACYQNYMLETDAADDQLDVPLTNDIEKSLNIQKIATNGHPILSRQFNRQVVLQDKHENIYVNNLQTYMNEKLETDDEFELDVDYDDFEDDEVESRASYKDNVFHLDRYNHIYMNQDQHQALMSKQAHDTNRFNRELVQERIESTERHQKKKKAKRIPSSAPECNSLSSMDTRFSPLAPHHAAPTYMNIHENLYECVPDEQSHQQTDKAITLYSSRCPKEINLSSHLDNNPSSNKAKLSSDSQVFLKEDFEHHLDVEARKLNLQAVLHIQKYARMFLVRSKFITMQKASYKLQAIVRMYLVR